MPRPPVSVVMPFHGGDAEARAALDALARIETRDGDELIVADNTPGGVMERHARAPVVCVRAGQVASSYYARNAGAERAANEWLLFIDADTVPTPGLLDAYFAAAPADDVGAIAGEIAGDGDQGALIPRYQTSRRQVGQAGLVEHPYRPMAVTANLLVRRAAWAQLGGFLEGMRSSGDADFSWRLQDAGWKLAFAPGALVTHRHRESVRALARQAARYGAGRTWLRRRHPHSHFASPLRGLLRCAAGIAVWTLTLRFERALFKAIDALWISAEATGALSSNVSAQPAQPAGATVVVAERFPADDEAARTARALLGTGRPVRVEAAARPQRPDRAAGAGLAVRYREDDGPARRLLDLLWLLRRFPVRTATAGRRRGPRATPLRELAPAARRIAGAAGLCAVAGTRAEDDARRLGRLLGIPVETP